MHRITTGAVSPSPQLLAPTLAPSYPPPAPPPLERDGGVNHLHHLLSRRKAGGGTPTAGVHSAYLSVRRRFPRCDSRFDRRSRSQSLFEAVPNDQDASQSARIRPSLLQESVRQPRVDSFSPCAESPACHVTLLFKRGENKHLSLSKNINWFAEEERKEEEEVERMRRVGIWGDLVRFQLKPRPTWTVPHIRSSTSYFSSPCLDRGGKNDRMF